MVAPQVPDGSTFWNNEQCASDWLGFMLQTKWQEAQLLTTSVVKHIRNFWREVPASVLERAYVEQMEAPDYNVGEAATPFYKHTPHFGSEMDAEQTSLHVGNPALEGVEVSVGELSTKAKWQLLKTFEYFTGAMATEVAQVYSERLAAALRDPTKTLRISLSGATRDQEGMTNHDLPMFTKVAVDSMVLELYHLHEWSVHSNLEDDAPFANHFHGAFVDMAVGGVDAAEMYDPIASHTHDEHEAH